MSKASFNAQQNVNSNRAPRSNGNGFKNFLGNKFIPSDDPPVINGSPWNHVTLDTTVTFGKTLSYFKQSELKDALINQLGFRESTKVNFEYRLISCSLWAYNSGNSSTTDYFRISVYPLSLIGPKGVELTRLESNGVKNKFAKVGYAYPITHTAQPFSTTSNDTELLAFISSEDTCSGFLHYKVMWRGANQGFATVVKHQFTMWVPVELRTRRKSENSFEELDLEAQDELANLSLAEQIERCSIKFKKDEC